MNKKDNTISDEETRRLVLKMLEEVEAEEDGIDEEESDDEIEETEDDSWDDEVEFDFDDHNDQEDYHNMSVDAVNRGNPAKAYEICEEGLEKFPNDPDLLADRITYAVNMNDMERALEAKEELHRILSMDRWNWRCFFFSCEFMIKADVRNYEAECRRVISCFKEYIPYDERSDLAEYLLEEALGNNDAALEVLERAVTDRSYACQCSVALCDLYLGRGRYEDVIKTANYGLAASAKPQEMVNTAYLLFLRALSEDHLIHMKIYRGETVTADELELVRSEYKLIQEEFLQFLHNYSNTIDIRSKLLSVIKAQ
ncbi:MAG: hypothetical protein IJ757_06060 [Clostridiales bacterium]|nr:hypothetical protein [Clostridiales bacterium]